MNRSRRHDSDAIFIHVNGWRRKTTISLNFFFLATKNFERFIILFPSILQLASVGGTSLINISAIKIFLPLKTLFSFYHLHLAYYSCTVHEVVTVPYAMRFHGLDAILNRPGTFCLDLMRSVFLARELVSIFCDTRSEMKRWRFSVYHRFVYSFSRSFQLSFFIIGKFPF